MSLPNLKPLPPRKSAKPVNPYTRLQAKMEMARQKHEWERTLIQHKLIAAFTSAWDYNMFLQIEEKKK